MIYFSSFLLVLSSKNVSTIFSILSVDSHSGKIVDNIHLNYFYSLKKIPSHRLTITDFTTYRKVIFSNKITNNIVTFIFQIPPLKTRLENGNFFQFNHGYYFDVKENLVIMKISKHLIETENWFGIRTLIYVLYASRWFRSNR